MMLYCPIMKKEHKDHKPHHNGISDVDQETLSSAEEVNSSTEPQESGEANARITELEATVSELKDKHLRLLAEFDNFKKRTMRERLELQNSASRDVMISLLPVLDDFDRAKKSADDPNTEEVFSEGVTLVYNRLYSILQNMGLKAMNSTGELFDAEFHEAITEIPVPDENRKGKVIDTLEKGYMLHDKIIRHAKVVVGN